MAGNTFQTGGPKAASRSAAATGNGTAVSEKEDLANFISMISRDETPFISSIGKTKATAVLHEWQTDELAVPVAGAQAEGVSYSTVNAAQVAEIYRTRLANYTQINSKTVTVTGTKRAVDQAGVADEYAYQLKKRGTELMRDVEYDAVSYQNSNGAGTRTMGGYFSWINYPTSASGTFLDAKASGTYVAPTNPGGGVSGTYSAASVGSSLTLSHVDQVMQAVYEQGGKATRLMLSPANRRVFSAKAQLGGSTTSNPGDGNVRRNVDLDGKLRQSVEIYMSDFGDIMVVPNYIMGIARTLTNVAQGAANWTAMVYDPSWWSIASLRPLQEVDLGQLGDSIIGQIIQEVTLECRNPKGSGAITGLTGA
jgi:hypothetical protein